MSNNKKVFIISLKSYQDITGVTKGLKLAFKKKIGMVTVATSLKELEKARSYCPDVIIGTSDLFRLLFFPKKKVGKNFLGIKFVFYAQDHDEFLLMKKITSKMENKANFFILDSNVSIGEEFTLKNALEKLGVFVSEIPPQNIPKGFDV